MRTNEPALDNASRGRGRGHVVVVGGGLAGLSAGLACADAGARVTLLEGRPRLGGATWSFERNGRWFDNGQHVFLRCCTAYRGFLDRIGTAGQVHLQDQLAVPVVAPGGKTAWIRRTSGLPAPFHLAPALARYGHLGLADRVRLGPAAVALGRLDLADPALDQVSFADWLATHGQRPAAVDGLWGLIVLPTANLPASEVSLAMAAKVFQTGLLSQADAADIGWAAAPLAQLHGESAATALERTGGTVRLRAKVDHIGPPTSTGLVVVADGQRLQADAVILAVPHTAAASLLPAGAIPHPELLDGLGVSPIVNVGVVYDRRVTDHMLAAGLGSPAQWVFDRTEAALGGEGAQSSSEEQVLGVSLSAADQWLGQRPEQLSDMITGALAELFPAARSARVLDTVVTRERAATFRAVPGTAALRPGTKTAVPGLALAGAWTDTGWPATMEGAVRSGQAAAREALHHLSRTAGAAHGGTGDWPSEVPARDPSHNITEVLT
ncbi:MAG: phytoene dehydrogenase [Acidimicrobiales bacterium]|nr:MAG: phytoene dehydrogenase [Acidimicrobiales bacterium]